MQWNGAFGFEFDGKSMETETAIWSKFLIVGKAIVEQILASEKRNISKRTALWEPQLGRVSAPPFSVRNFQKGGAWEIFKKMRAWGNLQRF